MTEHKLGKATLDRKIAVGKLVGNQEDFLFVTGLGGASRDVAALNDSGPNLFALGGTMGAAAGVGLGLALAQPGKQVMVVTGDGELLMNMGTLATIGVMAPANLSILCVDNGHWGETGYQISHSSLGVDVETIARGCGIDEAFTVETKADFERGFQVLHNQNAVSLVNLQVTTAAAPQVPRDRRGAVGRVNFREALLGPDKARQ